jgi:LPS O-antigen subunit length determinant protein (WzzB/FepE family)
MNNEDAFNEYLFLQEAVEAKMSDLRDKIEAQAENEEEINWSHVSDLKHALKVLENLINPI